MANTWGGIFLGDRANGHRSGVTAAALPLIVGRDRITPQETAWQDEVWAYFKSLGEFRAGVTWLSRMISRCRLAVARRQPGGDEPAVLTYDDDGLDDAARTALDLLDDLGGGAAGQAQLLRRLSVQLSVPGEGWLTGETVGDVNRWLVRSTRELRAHSTRESTFEVMDENSLPGHERWRPLAPESLVVRVWRPDEQYHHLPDSPARAARDAMRELQLANRRLQAQYLSRLASSGMVVFPNEVEFPAAEQFQDEPDPFVAWWVWAASQGIAEHGAPSSRVPVPVRVPGEYVDKIRFIDFTLKVDEKDLEKRNDAVKQLATELDLPAEILTGMGSLNHWTSWQLEESGIKVHISPDAELICDCLTVGYLQPRLRAAGFGGDEAGDLLVWYDTSELTVRPDRSDDAFQAYDRLEIDGATLRRETGFAEDDVPEDDELVTQALKVLLRSVPALAADAAAKLGILEPAPTPAPVPAPATTSEAAPTDVVAPAGEIPPNTRDEAPPPPDAGVAGSGHLVARDER